MELKDERPQSLKLDALQPSQHQILKALVGCVIEQSLVKLNPPVLNQVSKTLLEKYRCYMPDCYENPERLGEVLSNISNNVHNSAMKLVRKNLKEFTYQKPIKEFLEKLDKKAIANSLDTVCLAE
jgi:hypothetical protein